ncbi:MAG: hypothetical protein GF308_08960 [Candidatus Heimdallarchaeota archaeon]|nr:hypothetical protein [Candidatus Heimdallarchaeota archaeon]
MREPQLVQHPRKSEAESQRLSTPGTGDPPPCEKPISTYREESAGRRVYQKCSASRKGGGSE